jgi:hypothetical protein
MRKTRNALLGILTMMSGAILAVPTEAAEQYIPGVHLYKDQLSLWGLLSQAGEARVRQSLRQPRLRELLRPPVLLWKLSLSLLLVMRVLFFRSGRSPAWLKMKKLGCTCGEAPLFSAQARVGEPPIRRMGR